MVLDVHAWKRMGAHDTVINWIKDGIQIPFHDTPHSFEIQNPSFSIKEKAFVNSEICELLLSGAIRKCLPGEVPLCVSPIGCVPKKKDKFRLIVDLRHINEYVVAQSFQNENIDTVTQLIKPHDRLCSFDLRNGYHHVPVHKIDQQFLGIKWKGSYYVWQVLPFGLSCSSWYFCKTVRPVIQFLREQNIRITSYVDDLLLMCNDDVLTDHREFVVQTLTDLGFEINFDKSDVAGGYCIQYIGFNVHTGGKVPWITIPKPRIHKLKKDIRHCLKKGFVKARFLARIAGQCVSMCKAVLPGKLLLRNIYRLLGTRIAWNSVLALDCKSVEDLDWWLRALPAWNGAPLQVKAVDIQIETDASGSGWGAACGGKEASGIWSLDMQHKPSNYRELMAVHMAILSFKDMLKHKVVQVLSDNITTVAYLNHLGGHCIELSNLAQAIWCTTNSLNITLKAKFLAGNQNYHADRLSRLASHYEWMLDPDLFHIINRMWGPFSIDRFASFLTKQIPRYNSQFCDPLSVGVDALAQKDWGTENNFVNAPFRLIPQILTKIQAHQAEATIIAPWWPSQPWFNKLLSMTIATPLHIPQTRGSFIQWGPVIEPLKNLRWKIFAFRICGKIDSGMRVGVKRQQPGFPLHGQKALW
jgi:hypothetical protein